ncbi:hypothetical protein OG455_18260 [Kitasatospora sp. NBC_01287]|uniref:hypothetical protein n=1 Tax=Kitasatospora sp. NBC_01287 TaxID=2903573 RepID=UPI002253FF1F|nr:hypothetical protein [Kitasatospora sp. NBC_01287]MCX4747441.1 hypothetical protein [Kitasatospora sp. NBC_01287]
MEADDYSEVASWSSEFGGEPDSFDFVSARFSLGDWISIAAIFGPKFIEVDGCILWERAFERQNFEAWQAELSGDRARIEAVLNQLRLWQLIEYGESPEEAAAAAAIARSIAHCWRLRLAEQFPEARFTVAVHESEDGPIVTFNSVQP